MFYNKQDTCSIPTEQLIEGGHVTKLLLISPYSQICSFSFDVKYRMLFVGVVGVAML